MRGMLNIGVKSGLVLEMHDAAKRVAFSSGRNVRAHVGLEKSGDLALEGSDFSRRFILSGLSGIRLPLECEYVKDASWLVFCRRRGQASRYESGGRGCKAALAH